MGGLPELIGSDELVPPNDPAALSNKIVELLRNPARMTRLSQHNLKMAADFTSDVLRARRAAFYGHLRELTENWRQPRRNELQRAGSDSAAIDPR